MREAYIVATARTPIGRFGGALADLSPVELGAHAMRAAIERAAIDAGMLDLIVFGNVLRAGHGQLLPRQAAARAGIPDSVDGYAIDMVCSSGMMAVTNAALAVRGGAADLVLAGGMESMSQAGFTLSARARWGYKYLAGQPEPLGDVLQIDGLTDPANGEAMGAETERLATEYGITRAEVDGVAFASQQRAAQATADGRFAREIAPLTRATRQGEITIDRDEGIRADTTLEGLARLRPAFRPDGILTAGNASQISDGAAALLIASRDAVERHGLTPLARIADFSWAAGAGWRFAEAPIPALRKLAARMGVAIRDFDVIENNEAFAVNSVLLHRQLDVPYAKLNIYGGAIALGHPIGCSGARLLVTLITALQDTGGRLGVATLCHGTGGGTAVALERIDADRR